MTVYCKFCDSEMKFLGKSTDERIKLPRTHPMAGYKLKKMGHPNWALALGLIKAGSWAVNKFFPKKIYRCEPCDRIIGI